MPMPLQYGSDDGSPFGMELASRAPGKLLYMHIISVSEAAAVSVYREETPVSDEGNCDL
jgi:hypothetical protein